MCFVKLVRDNFAEFDINKLPQDVRDVNFTPPSGMSPYIEQLLIRSMSFSEFEMTSHPVLCLLVVSSDDPDPYNAMQVNTLYIDLIFV